MTDITRAMAKFVKWAMQEGPWDGCDLDGASVQDKAEELGLLVKTKYDPEIHGEGDDFGTDAGDDWFVLHPDVIAAVGGASSD